MNLKARISLGLAVLLLVSLAVTGVAYWSTQEALGPEVTPGLIVNGELVEDPGVMMTVNGTEIGFDEYRYYYLSTLAYMEMSYGTGIFEQDYDGALALELRAVTEETILQAQAILSLAEEKGISLTDEEKQEIVTEMDEQKVAMGEETYLRSLQDMFYTSEEMYIRMMEEQALMQKTQEALTEEYTAEIEADLESNFITAKHILISPDAFTQEAPTAEEDLLDSIGSEVTDTASMATSSVLPQDDSVATSVAQEATSELVSSSVAPQSTSVATELSAEEMAEQAMLLAEDLLAQLREAEAAGLDTTEMFDQMVVDYGSDPGMESSPEGYTFGEGVMTEAFYEAAKALEPNTISEVVETEFGYHIIRREPLNTAAFEEGGSAEFEVDSLVQTRLSEEITTIMENMEVSYGENYEFVSPTTIQ